MAFKYVGLCACGHKAVAMDDFLAHINEQSSSVHVWVDVPDNMVVEELGISTRRRRRAVYIQL